MTPMRCRGYMGESYEQAPHDAPPADFNASKPTQCRRCYGAYAAEWRAGRAAKGIVSKPRLSAASTSELVVDGVTPLIEVLGRAGLTVVQAVAKYATFLPPATVEQTHGKALFPIIRNFGLRGQAGVAHDGRPVFLDDNTTPTRAFVWAGGLRRGRDVQFNHLWTDSQNPETYTALWNLCATPNFLAKTTDGSNYPDVVAAVRFRAFSLYGRRPESAPDPVEPPGYADLEWAPHPDPVPDLEALLRAKLRSNPKSRAAIAARTIGWLFSDGKSDPTI